MRDKRSKYDPATTPFVIFDMAKNGHTDGEIAEALGLSVTRFVGWKKERPDVANALKQGRRGGISKTDVINFREYVIGRLPPHLRELWDDIERADHEPNRIEIIEVLLERQGKTSRQALFLHALLATGYDVSRACRMVNITRQCLKNWVQDDLDFGELVDEIQTIKKDFLEGALMRLCLAGDTKAIIFANKTLNKDRGYGEHIQIDANVQGDRFSVDDLELTLEQKKEMLKKIREKKAQRAAVTIDAVETRRIK